MQDQLQDQPMCCLCQGPLRRQKKVPVQPGGRIAIYYALAWVCTNCSAAFPIALGKGGIVRNAEPMFEEGKRIK